MQELFARLGAAENNCSDGCVLASALQTTLAAQSGSAPQLATVSGTLLRAALALCADGSADLAYPLTLGGRRRLQRYSAQCDGTGGALALAS